jgi:hypothetical protein
MKMKRVTSRYLGNQNDVPGLFLLQEENKKLTAFVSNYYSVPPSDVLPSVEGSELGS